MHLCQGAQGGGRLIFCGVDNFSRGGFQFFPRICSFTYVTLINNFHSQPTLTCRFHLANFQTKLAFRGWDKVLGQLGVEWGTINTGMEKQFSIHSSMQLSRMKSLGLGTLASLLLMASAYPQGSNYSRGNFTIC